MEHIVTWGEKNPLWSCGGQIQNFSVQKTKNSIFTATLAVFYTVGTDSSTQF